MEVIEKVLMFIDKHAPWAGFILMSVIGGVVAHVREWEAKFPDYTLRQHAFAVSRRAVMAVFAGAIWFKVMEAQGWLSSPYAYVGASLVGLFAPEFLDLLWGIFKQRVLGAANTTNHLPPKP